MTAKSGILEAGFRVEQEGTRRFRYAVKKMSSLVRVNTYINLVRKGHRMKASRSNIRWSDIQMRKSNTNIITGVLPSYYETHVISSRDALTLE